MGQRTGGNIEDIDAGAVPSAGDSNAPNGESRDSSTEQPRKGGTQQWASPRGGAHRAGECPGPEVQHHGMYFLISRASLLQSRSLGLVAVAAGRDLLVMPAGWLGPALGIHPSMCPLPWAPFVCMSPRPLDTPFPLSFSMLFHHMHPGYVMLQPQTYVVSFSVYSQSSASLTCSVTTSIPRQKEWGRRIQAEWQRKG